MGNSSSNGRWRVRHEGHVQGVGGERDSTSDKDQEECEHKVKGCPSRARMIREKKRLGEVVWYKMYGYG